MLNREIKFRGKRIDNDTFIFGFLLTFLDETTYILVLDKLDDTFDKYEVHPDSVGQFTGLKDKNDVERYETDIIKRNTGYVFIEAKKVFLLGETNGAKAFGYDYHSEDEIIGNVFDNPELLK